MLTKRKKMVKKRPRGFDALLDHLLVKMNTSNVETSQYKGPRIFQSKVDTRSLKMEMHRMTPNWPWTINSQKYSAGTKYLPLRPKFWSILLYHHKKGRQKLEMHRKTTQTKLKHLNTVKSTLYTLNTYSWGSNFGPFRSTISRFRDTICTRSAKIGNAPNYPKLNLNTSQSKVLDIHYSYCKVQILVRFALRLAVSEIQHVQGQWKLEMHRMTPKWTWRLNSQNYPVSTTYLLQRAKFWSVLLCD